MALTEKKKLGQLLCERQYLDPTGLDDGLAYQQLDHQPLGRILVEKGYITAAQLNEALAFQAGIACIDHNDMDVDPEVIALIPAEFVSRHKVFPLHQGDGRLDVAMANPFDYQALEELRLLTRLSIRRHFSHPADLERAILKYYGSHVARMLEDLAPDESAQTEEYANGDYSPSQLHELAREPSLVNLVNLILLEAIDARASDIHIEPFEHQVKIKYRIDGVLIEKSPSPKRLQAAIISRIKIMANMNIAERFVPQDGHIGFSGKTGKVDIRVSTVPTVFGESVTMRLLDRSASLISLGHLGMNEQTLKRFKHCLAKAHGIVLVTGPTGSGKTTTLYAALNHIYTPSQKIITIEDPVEYQLEGIIQMPVNPKRGLTFAKGLRHIVRQDPDIIMVGEIRDHETADIAIRAALTGHLVFSTLHTNDAPGAVTRLLDMGVEPFLLSSSLEAVLAQRLVRKICVRCKQTYHPDENIIRSLNNSISISPDATVYHGTGCDECLNTGMKGRIGIFELLEMTPALREIVAQRPSSEQIVKAVHGGHRSMRHDGIEKILQGITTAEEVLRITQGIEES